MIGRELERRILLDALESAEPELVAVYGRRRVGKTYMVRQICQRHMVFDFSGLFDSNVPEHLQAFAKSLEQYGSGLPLKPPLDWFEAFNMLKRHVTQHRTRRKKVVFLDEMPWLATNKSRFLTAFESFWNGWASTQSNLVVVICGSASSWMIKKILKNTGGLYNRTTRRIHLRPFNLQETELFLRKNGIALTRHQITQIYMVMGGVPHYLKEIRKGESAAQAIDRICFTSHGLLVDEYEQIYDALFHNAEKHKQIVKILSEKPSGRSRDELLRRADLVSGGGFTSILAELDQSGFIDQYIPYRKKSRDAIYKLTDNFSLFHAKFMSGRRRSSLNWNALANSASWKSWSGLAFENVCQYHIAQIKDALRISGIHSEAHFWHHPGNDEIGGAQIDLLIDRADQVINICEIKFSEQPYVISKSYAEQIRRRMAAFRQLTKTRKSLFLTMITSHGVLQNKHSLSLLQSEVSLDDLFA